MLNSMTGFTSLSGTAERHSWMWELRSVNGKGLDIRVRLPEGMEGLEAKIRSRLSKALARGTMTVSLRLRAVSVTGSARLDLDRVTLVLEALRSIEARALDKGVALAPSRASDILALPGVFDQTSEEAETTDLQQAVLAGFDQALIDFGAVRQKEGSALAAVLECQIDQIAALVTQAAAQAEARKPQAEAQFRAALARVSSVPDVPVDEARIAQELAMLAVRADVTEELDRLRTHCAAARALLVAGSPVGRKLDFLMQEFNREANTLCSKAQNTDLTATGLELKSVIEQMREQVQNVE